MAIDYILPTKASRQQPNVVALKSVLAVLRTYIEALPGWVSAAFAASVSDLAANFNETQIDCNLQVELLKQLMERLNDYSIQTCEPQFPKLCANGEAIPSLLAAFTPQKDRAAIAKAFPATTVVIATNSTTTSVDPGRNGTSVTRVGVTDGNQLQHAQLMESDIIQFFGPHQSRQLDLQILNNAKYPDDVQKLYCFTSLKSPRNYEFEFAMVEKLIQERIAPFTAFAGSTQSFLALPFEVMAMALAQDVCIADLLNIAKCSRECYNLIRSIMVQVWTPAYQILGAKDYNATVCRTMQLKPLEPNCSVPYPEDPNQWESYESKAGDYVVIVIARDHCETSKGGKYDADPSVFIAFWLCLLQFRSLNSIYIENSRHVGTELLLATQMKDWEGLVTLTLVDCPLMSEGEVRRLQEHSKFSSRSVFCCNIVVTRKPYKQHANVQGMGEVETKLVYLEQLLPGLLRQGRDYISPRDNEFYLNPSYLTSPHFARGSVVVGLVQSFFGKHFDIQHLHNLVDCGWSGSEQWEMDTDELLTMTRKFEQAREVDSNFVIQFATHYLRLHQGPASRLLQTIFLAVSLQDCLASECTPNVQYLENRFKVFRKMLRDVRYCAGFNNMQLRACVTVVTNPDDAKVWPSLSFIFHGTRYKGPPAAKIPDPYWKFVTSNPLIAQLTPKGSRNSVLIRCSTCENMLYGICFSKAQQKRRSYEDAQCRYCLDMELEQDSSSGNFAWSVLNWMQSTFGKYAGKTSDGALVKIRQDVTPVMNGNPPGAAVWNRDTESSDGCDVINPPRWPKAKWVLSRFHATSMAQVLQYDLIPFLDGEWKHRLQSLVTGMIINQSTTKAVNGYSWRISRRTGRPDQYCLGKWLQNLVPANELAGHDHPYNNPAFDTPAKLPTQEVVPEEAQAHPDRDTRMAFIQTEDLGNTRRDIAVTAVAGPIVNEREIAREFGARRVVEGHEDIMESWNNAELEVAIPEDGEVLSATGTGLKADCDHAEFRMDLARREDLDAFLLARKDAIGTVKTSQLGRTGPRH